VAILLPRNAMHGEDYAVARCIHLHLHLFRSKKTITVYNKVTKEQDNKAHGMI